MTQCKDIKSYCFPTALNADVDVFFFLKKFHMSIFVLSGRVDVLRFSEERMEILTLKSWESSMSSSQHLIILRRAHTAAPTQRHTHTQRHLSLNAKDAFLVTRNVHGAMGMRV